MIQRPVIYVRQITNLSDARYCAGMGADMLGYVIDPAHPDYVSPKLYQEMSGWVAGPKRVVELAGAHIDHNELIANYNPDLVHIQSKFIGDYQLPGLPLIVEINFSESEDVIRKISDLNLHIAYLLITGLSDQSFISPYPILVELGGNIPSVIEFVNSYNADGLALQGSREEAPGLKDYDGLSRVLEEFESF